MAGFTSDDRGAFRQNPVHPEQIPFMWSVVWHPVWQEPVLLRNLGQVFGGAGSQFNYIRDPAATCTVMRSYFQVPMFHFSDDARCFERKATIGSAWFCWVWLNNIIGWALDMQKTPLPSGAVRLLGAIIHLNVPRPFASLPSDKVENLITDIDVVLLKRSMTNAEAASYRGRLGWARSFLFGRYGSAALVPLRCRQYSDKADVRLSPAIEEALLWFRRTLLDHPPREMPFELQNWPFIVTISDGEGTGSVAVALWMPREPQFQPLLTRVD